MDTSKKSSNNFLVQGSILAIASIIVRLIGLVYRIPLTNIIGYEGIGYYSYAFDIYNIALILSSYSLPLAVSKMISARNSKKEYNNAFRIFVGSMSFAIVSGLIMSLIIYLGADVIATKIYKNPQIAIPLKVLAPTILIVAVLGVFRGFFQGKNTMLPTSISQIVEQIVNAIVSIVAAYILIRTFSANKHVAAYGAAGSTLGTCIGAFFALLFLIFVFMLYWPTIKKQRRKDKSNTTETYLDIYKILILTIVPVIISQTVYQVSGFLDGMLFSNILHGNGIKKDVISSLSGVYSLYKLLTNVPISISSALASAIVPSIVAAYVMNERKEIKKKVHLAIKFNMIVAIPATVGMGVLASPIMQLLFHDNSKLSANLMIYGVVAIIFFSLSTITNAVLQGINQMRLPVIHSAISLGIHIVIVILLLKLNFGIYGLIIGNVTFPLVVCIMNAFSIKKYLGFKQEYVKTYLIPGLSSLVMGIFTFITYFGLYKLSHQNSISTILAILIAVITYFICMVVLKGITEEELKRVPKGNLIITLLHKFQLLK